MRLPRTSASVTVLLTVAMSIAACGHGLTDPAIKDFSGVYSLSGTRQGVVCTPQPLPAPVSSDSTLYIQSSLQPLQVTSRVRFVQSSNSPSLAPLDSMGHAGVTLAGMLDSTFGTGKVTFRSVSSRVEGPRFGAHTFAVSDSVVVNAYFQTLISIPGRSGQSGVGAASVIVTRSEVLTFRDGRPQGTIFTTCVVSEAQGGGRSGT